MNYLPFCGEGCFEVCRYEISCFKVEGQGDVNLTPPTMVIPKMYLLERKRSPFFVSFIINSFFEYYQKSHLSWKFHLNSSSRSDDMNIFSVNINGFDQFFNFFWHFFATKKLMTSTVDATIFFLLSTYLN